MNDLRRAMRKGGLEVTEIGEWPPPAHDGGELPDGFWLQFLPQYANRGWLRITRRGQLVTNTKMEIQRAAGGLMDCAVSARTLAGELYVKVEKR